MLGSRVQLRDVNVGQQDVVLDAHVGQVKAPIQCRGGLQSQITLGEEITWEIYGTGCLKAYTFSIR